jgi:hypothetical protein
MYINDIGVVYRPSKNKDDFMFCIDCATHMTMAMAQDISKVGNPDIALSYYFQFKTPDARARNLRRHANALKELSLKMEDQASAFELFGDKA